ncbi:MAG TPA: cytochrome b/b6 domain-containing protein [Usitatibacter sp.]|nr:cytochrome b/b6 domain-containing protein [Usitatibacter sp.]
MYRRHALAVRIMHWINAIAVVVLLMSGLQIFNAHPALYWGKSSYTGAGPILAPGRLPAWLTLPGGQWLAMGRRWHLFFAWVLVVNGAAYIAYSVASRHLSRDLWPTREDLRAMPQSIRDHLRLRHPRGEAARRYNALQRLAYVAIVLVVLPFLVLMGLGMSPALDTVIPGWVDLFGGRQSVRTLHFAAAMLVVAFAAVHVVEVIVSGAWNNLRSMITGMYRVPPEDSP